MSKGPDFEVLSISEYEQNGEKKTRFTKIGVLFERKGQPGYMMYLDALPIGGKCLIQPPRPKDGDL